MTLLFVTLLLQELGGKRSSGLWSCQLASLCVILLPYKQAGERAVWAPVFSGCPAQGRAFVPQVRAGSPPKCTCQELNLCNRQLRSSMRHADVLPNLGRYNSLVFSDAPSQSEVSIVMARKGERKEQVMVEIPQNRLCSYLSCCRYSGIKVSSFAVCPQDHQQRL